MLGTIKKLTNELVSDLKPSTLFPSLIAGCVAGILAITFMFSYSAVMFTGDLAGYVPRATGGMLFGAVIIALVISLSGAIKGAVALPQDNPTAIIAVMVAAIAPSLAGDNIGDQVFINVLTIICLSTLLAGICFWAIGHWQLAALVQYIPYPVIGGFLAGTGWLLFKGSFSVMGGASFDLMNLGALVPDLKLCIPGVIYGLIVTIAAYRYSHFMIMPGLIVLGIITFYTAMMLSGASIQNAIDQRFLLQPFGEGGLWQPLDLNMIDQIQWLTIFQEAGGIATIIVIAVISVLLNLTALESAFGEEVDMNRELKLAGLANFGAAMGGGLIGYHYVSLSTLGHRMKGDSRIVGLVVALICFLALSMGANALSYFPKFILGGLVMFVGLSFLYDWVYQSWKRLPLADFLIILGILIVVETLGFLEGVVTGISAAAVLFVINYSRVNVVRHTLSGKYLHANLERPEAERKFLMQHGDQTLVLTLQGFIFFASASSLQQQIKAHFNDSSTPLSFLIIDFKHVTGLDSSALHGFVKMKQQAQENSIRLVFCGISKDIHQVFITESFADGDAVVEQMFLDVDHALEWCEAELIASLYKHQERAQQIDKILAEMFSKAEWEAQFKQRLLRKELAAGDYLFKEHQHLNAFFLIEKGTFSVSLHEDGHEFRLRKVGAGALLGVASFFQQHSDRALVSARADSDAIIYKMTREEYEKLHQQKPELIATFQQDLLKYFADRTAANVYVLQAVLRIDE